jgi:hypothetical protein
MISFAIGFIAACILYTFFPSLAVVPSNWLRSLRDRVKDDDYGV